MSEVSRGQFSLMIVKKIVHLPEFSLGGRRFRRLGRD
jgi:hypothetical protein